METLNVQHVAIRVAKKIRDDQITLTASALAYRYFLALFPFLIFLTALGGALATTFRAENPADTLVDLMAQAVPSEASTLMRTELNRIVQQQSHYLLSISILSALAIATAGTNTTIQAMNAAYDVEETRPFWSRLSLSFGLTVLTGVMFIVILLLVAVGVLLGSSLADRVGIGGLYWQTLASLRWPSVFLLLVFALAVFYWKAPNTDVRFLWTIPGAVICCAGWLVTSHLFGAYASTLGRYGATYGTLEGAAVLLIWFYMLAILLLLGAELNASLDGILDNRES